MDPLVARVLAGLAAGTAVGGLVLAGLDSPGAVVCAFGFLVAVMLPALAAGLSHHL